MKTLLIAVTVISVLVDCRTGFQRASDQDAGGAQVPQAPPMPSAVTSTTNVEMVDASDLSQSVLSKADLHSNPMLSHVDEAELRSRAKDMIEEGFQRAELVVSATVIDPSSAACQQLAAVVTVHDVLTGPGKSSVTLTVEGGYAPDVIDDGVFVRYVTFKKSAQYILFLRRSKRCLGPAKYEYDLAVPLKGRLD